MGELINVNKTNKTSFFFAKVYFLKMGTNLISVSSPSVLIGRKLHVNGHQRIPNQVC